MHIQIFMIFSLMKKNNSRPITYNKRQFFRYLLLIVHCSLFIVLYSCKESDIVGLPQVTGQGQRLQMKPDSTKIVAYSLKEDSVETNGTSLNLVGNIVDPTFGKTCAGFYSQVFLNSSSVSFGTGPVLDSMVLSLSYAGYYGDVSKPQTINVYELTDDLSSSTSYYSTDKKHYNSIAIGSKTNFIPKPKDSIYVMINGINTKIAPELRIKIDPTYAFDKFLSPSSSSYLSSNASFINYFKGLYIAPDTSKQGSSILYFDLISSQTLLTAYYHNSTGDVTNYSYSFIITTDCARYNYFNHFKFNQANSDFTKQVINPKDTTLGDKVLYVQAMGGTKAKISFPELTNLLAKGNIAINKAVLILKPNLSLSSDTSIFKFPSQLALLRIKKDGTTSVPPDYYVGSSYYGGTYNKTTNEYRFNLALYIQDILNNKITGDKGLYAIVNGASGDAGRLILNGPKANISSDKLRLEITYTELGNKKK